MPLVIPRWRAHAVRDWKGLLVGVPEGGSELNAATAALLNYMPIIGITTLTENSASDAWCRIAILEALFGSVIKDSNTGQPYYFTKSDVLRHVGAETEGTEQSFLDFCNSIHQRAQLADEVQLPSFVANNCSSLLKLLGLAGNEGGIGTSK